MRPDCLPLMQMQMHLSGRHVEAYYTRAIRDWLTACGNQPLARRQLTDPTDDRSLLRG
jgi:hypothetical protein